MKRKEKMTEGSSPGETSISENKFLKNTVTGVFDGSWQEKVESLPFVEVTKEKTNVFRSKKEKETTRDYDATVTFRLWRNTHLCTCCGTKNAVCKNRVRKKLEAFSMFPFAVNGVRQKV